MAYYAETGRSRPLIHVALTITLLGIRFFLFSVLWYWRVDEFLQKISKILVKSALQKRKKSKKFPIFLV
jgi:hypothetical protein